MSTARMKLVWRLPLLAILVVGCGEQTQPPKETQAPASKPDVPNRPLPDEQSPPRAQPPAEPQPLPPAPPATSQPVAQVEVAPIPPVKEPKRPKDSWVIFRAPFDKASDVACDARWTGENRLEVNTDNVQRVTIDMRRLPEGAPTKGPWNLQIDKQGIQITGFRGKVMDLVRSKNGIWTVDRTKPRKRG